MAAGRKSNQGEMMKKLTVMICALGALASVAFGGTETYTSGKEMKQAVQQQAPCPEWYRDTEWDVSLWGTYAFTGNAWRDDRYLGVDHAWGGGIDARYFFHRYFGIGVEGYGLARNEHRGTVVGPNGFSLSANNGSGAAGSVLGTFTFRYPMPPFRFVDVDPRQRSSRGHLRAERAFAKLKHVFHSGSGQHRFGKKRHSLFFRLAAHAQDR